MGRSLRAGIVAATGLVALATSPSASAATSSSVTPASVDAVVRDFRDATGLPGAAVVITHGTQIVHAEGYGHTPTGAAITAVTPMAMASVSKSFTALAVMQLVEADKVDLDTPVRASLPEFEMADPRADEITVRQLLQHTSGMSDTTFPAFSRPQPASLREAVGGMRTYGLAATPGTRWEYHNPNFQVAARLVEVVSGQSFTDYLDTQVFDPLGMDHSRTIDTDRDLPPTARGHLTVLGRAVSMPEPHSFGNGSGGVLSTAQDMAAWLIVHNNQGRATDGTRIVSPQSIRQMHTPSRVSDSYGMGWFIGETEGGTTIIQHGGDLFTSTAYQALLPESGYGIAVMTNSGTTHQAATALAASLIALIEGQDVPRTPRNLARAHQGADAAFVAASIAAVALAGFGVWRSRRWAARRAGAPWWRTAVRMVLLVVPLPLFAMIDQVVSFLYRGRDVTWVQVTYLFPTFMILLGATALACTAVAVARITQLAWGLVSE